MAKLELFEDAEGLEPGLTVHHQGGQLAVGIDGAVGRAVLLPRVEIHRHIAEGQLLETQRDLEAMGGAGAPAAVEDKIIDPVIDYAVYGIVQLVFYSVVDYLPRPSG